MCTVKYDTKTAMTWHHKNNSIMSHSGEVSPVILWDTLTAVMRGKIISITAYMKKLKRQRLADFQGKLKQLHLLGDVLIVLKWIPNQHWILKNWILKSEIDDIYTFETQKKFIFLKQKYYEVGGKSAKFLSYKLCKE